MVHGGLDLSGWKIREGWRTWPRLDLPSRFRNPGKRKGPRDNLADATHLSLSINGQLFLSCALNLVRKLVAPAQALPVITLRLNLGSANSPERPEHPEHDFSPHHVLTSPSANLTFGLTQRFYEVSCHSRQV